MWSKKTSEVEMCTEMENVEVAENVSKISYDDDYNIRESIFFMVGHDHMLSAID